MMGLSAKRVDLSEEIRDDSGAYVEASARVLEGLMEWISMDGES